MKYLGTICLFVLIALGSVGVGFSAWQQNIGVAGKVETGSWNSADYLSIDLSSAPNCTVESQSPRAITIKVHFKDNSRHAYNGNIICPIINNGTIPVTVEEAQIAKVGPDRDPSANDLIVTPTGALVESSHVFVGTGLVEQAGLLLSGNPDKGDYLVTVSFITDSFTPQATP